MSPEIREAIDAAVGGRRGGSYIEPAKRMSMATARAVILAFLTNIEDEALTVRDLREDLES